ncbi:DnaA ATPase domain-containing protein [Mycoplasmopsis hyopharyngis]|uniref:DnaA ATPase domain-containing protein n=1 Tax=Mycoplasmopsis hyopharyngis TaxID=29558 RepID=UPI003873BD57
MKFSKIDIPSKDKNDKNMLAFIKKEPKLQKIISSLKITDEEILENSLIFLNAIESFSKKNDQYIVSYDISRDAKNKLIFKEKVVNNNFALELERFLNLYLTEISEPNSNYLLKKFSVSNLQRQEIMKQFKLIAKTKEKNVNAPAKGLYIYGKTNSGKSYILQSFANYFSSSQIKTSYLAIEKLYKALIKKIQEREANNSGNNQKYFIELIKNIDVLIIDNLGLENKSEWFVLEVLSEILEYRNENNLLTFFGSPFKIDELFSLYLQKYSSAPEKKYKIEKLIKQIKNLTLELEIQE